MYIFGIRDFLLADLVSMNTVRRTCAYALGLLMTHGYLLLPVIRTLYRAIITSQCIS
jgi:hypothetical protein